jgi:hypothetical protein
MKQDIVENIVKCLECQQVKVEIKNPARILRPLQIIEWKWETIFMDFVTGFPKTIKKHDEIMVILDKLSKEANFIPIESNFKAIDSDNVFMREIFVGCGA